MSAFSNQFFIKYSNGYIDIPEVEYDEIMRKCNKNKSKTCFHKNFSPNGRLKTKYFIDNLQIIWTKDILTKNLYTRLYRKEEDDPEVLHINDWFNNLTNLEKKHLYYSYK